MWFLFSLLLVIDRLTKYVALKKLSPGQSYPLIKNIFHLTLVKNSGTAFGFFKGQNYFLILISLLAVILIIFELKRARLVSLVYRVSLILILSGAIGNLIDRVFLGYVVDFLDFRVWPVFNLADTCISVGAVGLGFSLLKKDR